MSAHRITEEALQGIQVCPHPGAFYGMAHGVFRHAHGTAAQICRSGIDILHDGKTGGVFYPGHQLDGFSEQMIALKLGWNAQRKEYPGGQLVHKSVAGTHYRRYGRAVAQ